MVKVKGTNSSDVICGKCSGLIQLLQHSEELAWCMVFLGEEGLSAWPV